MSVWQIAVVSLSQERKQKEGVDHEDEGALVCENMNLGGTSSISRGDVTSSSDVKGVVPVGGDIWYPGRPQPRGNGHFVQDVDEPRVARRGEEGRRGIQVWRCGAVQCSCPASLPTQNPLFASDPTPGRQSLSSQLDGALSYLVPLFLAFFVVHHLSKSFFSFFTFSPRRATSCDI